MPRRKPVSLSINHERWLVSYSDFITLLFAFFVVMYSISQVNESKYRVLSDTLVDAFEPEKRVARTLQPIQVGDPIASDASAVLETPEPAPEAEREGDGHFRKTVDFPQLAGQFTQEFGELAEEERLQVQSNEFWLQIDVDSSILFDSASAIPSNEAVRIFADMAETLKGYDNPIQVEGYTDDVPINSSQFPSNWELSAARAAAIVRLLAENGIEPQRLSAVGFGEYQPIAQNDSDLGRQQNRRVVLMMAKAQQPRPQLKTRQRIQQAAGESAVSLEQPFPQPNLEVGNTEVEETSGAETIPSSTTQQETRPVLAPDKALEEADEKETTTDLEIKDGLEPIQLDNGGLLFTSDPDLPRNTD